MIPINSSYFKKKLYRFEPFDEDRIQTLKNNKFWLSMAKLFNDPFDSQALISEPLYMPETFTIILKNQIDKHKSSMAWPLLKAPESPCVDKNGLFVPSNWRKSIEENLRSVAMSCFCENWNNLQLWSYYAQSHKGICLEYEFNFGTLLESRTKNVFRPINYATHYPTMELDNLLESRNPLEKVTSLLCTKDISWQHEKEWRLIMFDKKGGETIDMPEGVELTSVLAGSEMSSSNYKILEQICEELNVGCEQLKKDLRKSHLVRSSDPYEEHLWRVGRR